MCKYTPKILICWKSGQNPWKFGHRCFDTFVLFIDQWDWLMKYVWICHFFSKKNFQKVSPQKKSTKIFIFFVREKFVGGKFAAQTFFGHVRGNSGKSFEPRKIFLLAHLCLSQICYLSVTLIEQHGWLVWCSSVAQDTIRRQMHHW